MDLRVSTIDRVEPIFLGFLVVSVRFRNGGEGFNKLLKMDFK